jgi:arylsulfatase A-like enzyme
MSDRPNILVIMTDQQKATAIQMYGNRDVPTPSLERLAARGTQYQNCYTPQPLCTPARVSFWTGRYPHRHGSRTNELPMPPDERHFAHLLNESGYKLGHIGKDHCFQPVDYDLFAERSICGHLGPDETEDSGEAEVVDWLHNDSQQTPWSPAHWAINPNPADSCPTAVLTRRATRFLEKQTPEQPFFLWLSIPDPHEPYQCPEPYASMHPPDQISLPPWPDDDNAHRMERLKVFRRLFDFAEMPEDQIRRCVSIYYGMIRFIDDAVGELLDTLDRLKLSDNTIVVFTSDHGDYAGERGLMGKSSALYDAMTRVPLIVSMPGRVPEGVVDHNLVSLLDVMPSCLGLAGIDRPTGIDGQMLPGTGDDPPRDAVFAEYGAGGPRLHLEDVADSADPIWDQMAPPIPFLRWREAEGHPKMVRSGNYKYIYDPMDETDELYDLEADPWELTNLSLSPEHASVRSDLQARLLRWSICTEGGHPTQLFFDPETGLNTEKSFLP